MFNYKFLLLRQALRIEISDTGHFPGHDCSPIYKIPELLKPKDA